MAQVLDGWIKINMKRHYYTNGLEGKVISDILSAEHSAESPSILWITDACELDVAKQNVKFFNPEIEVIDFYSYDVDTTIGLSPSQHIVLNRITSLMKISKYRQLKKSMVIITDYAAIRQVTTPIDILNAAVIHISVNQVVNRDLLIKRLVNIGYRSAETAYYPGEFAARGGILDIAPFDADQNAYRLDFAGNTICTIRNMDMVTQRSGDALQDAIIIPCHELILSAEVLNFGIQNIYAKLGISGKKWVETFQNQVYMPGQESFLELFFGTESTILSCIDDTFSLLLHDDFEHKLEVNCQIECNKQNNLSIHDAKAINNIYQEIQEKIRQYTINILDFFEKSNNTPYISLPIGDFHSKIHYMLNTYLSQFIVIIGCNSEQIIAKICNKINLLHPDAKKKIVNNINAASKTYVNIGLLLLNKNIRHDNYIFIKASDLIGDNSNYISNSKKRKKAFFDTSGFAIGELVVHQDHGVGEFCGIESIEVSNITRDFVKLIYLGGDKLFIPVENLDVITRYGAESGQVDKLGGTAWPLRKASLKKRIKISAQELLKSAAARKLAKAESYYCDPFLYDSFLSLFQHVETQDQLDAVSDIASDLMKCTPMDRLICGDVGFGKTEVAIRAAFIVVASEQVCKPQVLVLVPTTLLSRQHYKTFSERFNHFGFKVRQLSKFTAKKDIKAIKAEIASGEADIIIGTHALLSNDMKFFNIGLVIIDEEQHFGVKQKERLCNLKESTHVLTLSATPIPRTLHLAISGIKDLSIIATPPFERLPIKTFVSVFNTSVIKDAITFEISRNGRVFYITPRVSYIPELVDGLKKVLPNIKIGVAHGGMSSSELDNTMGMFYDGDFDVLVCTTIIESGLDIPAANTIIIDRSHMFGLSQLYQIRGRVGRGSLQGYAYLLYPYGMSEISRTRLEIISSHNALGSGFSIANCDMDIRGYGNLVGQEQSGLVRDVGVELYQKMLESAISELKAEINLEDTNISDESDIIILNLGISAQIPQEYISDMQVRLNLYRKIANITDEADIHEIEAEIFDRFGALPESTQNFLKIIRIKILSRNIGLKKVDITEKGIILCFLRQSEKVLNYLANNKITARLKDENKIFISSTIKQCSSSDILKKLEDILRAI